MTTAKKFISKQVGFTMIELLLALLCLSICIPLFARMMFVVVNAMPHDFEAEDRIGIAQLQVIVAQSDTFEILDNEVHMRYHGDNIRIVHYVDKVVKRSGFEVLLQNIDRVQFQLINNCLHIHWQRGERSHEAVLGCE